MQQSLWPGGGALSQLIYEDPSETSNFAQEFLNIVFTDDFLLVLIQNYQIFNIFSLDPKISTSVSRNILTKTYQMDTPIYTIV